MCGIVGFNGKPGLSPKKLKDIRYKILMIGLYSETRGGNNCGVFINGNVYHGFDNKETKKDQEKFYNLIGDPDWLFPNIDLSKSNSVMIHNRKSTCGSHSASSCHPFIIKTDNPENDLILQHNGTISTWTSLCNKYKVDHTKIFVDSHGLATLIAKEGIKVLEEYEGDAALMWVKPSDTSSLWVYHGWGFKTHADKEKGLYTEERPLFYMETSEGVYFSSMINSLYAIRDNMKEVPQMLIHNEVIRVTNGVFTEDRVKINRSEKNLKTYSNYSENWPNMGERAGIATRKNINYSKSSNIIPPAIPKNQIVEQELPLKKSVPSIAFWKGRYRYTETGEEAHGLIYVGDRGVISDVADEKSKIHWFYEGCMLNAKYQYDEILTRKEYAWLKTPRTANYADNMSRYTNHPVCNLGIQAANLSDYTRYAWYSNFNRISMLTLFRPEWSGRTYVIENGFCTEIKTSNKEDKIFDSKNNFDLILTSATTFYKELTKNEQEACKMWVSEQLCLIDSLQTEKEVRSSLYFLIKQGVENDHTIREALLDTSDNLETCLAIYEYEQEKLIPDVFRKNLEIPLRSNTELVKIPFEEDGPQYEFPWKDNEQTLTNTQIAAHINVLDLLDRDADVEDVDVIELPNDETIYDALCELYEINELSTELFRSSSVIDNKVANVLNTFINKIKESLHRIFESEKKNDLTNKLSKIV